MKISLSLGQKIHQRSWQFFLVTISLLIIPLTTVNAQAQSKQRQGIIIRSDIQEANSKTQIITARGNVQLAYPSRNIQARANIAQYFIKEKRIILSGNVYVVQQGSSLEGETIVYLIEEGRFIAQPKPNRQVTAVYAVPEEGF